VPSKRYVPDENAPHKLREVGGSDSSGVSGNRRATKPTIRDFQTVVDPKLGTYGSKPASPPANAPRTNSANKQNIYQTYRERLDAQAAVTRKWIEKRGAESGEQSGKVTEQTDQIKKEFIDRSKKLTPEQRKIFNQLQTSSGQDGSSGDQVQLTDEEIAEFAKIKAEQDEYWNRVSNTMSDKGWKKFNEALDKYQNGSPNELPGEMQDFGLPRSRTNRPIPKGNDEIETLEDKTKREDNEWLQLIKSPHAHYSDEWK
jgi:hypothetical protein